MEEEMKNNILGATTTHCEGYRELTDVQYFDAIYKQFLRKDERIAITKWRLSSHDLLSKTPREEKTCSKCPACLEDEDHVLFQCPLYESVRLEFRDTFIKLSTTHAMLNPIDIQDANVVGEILFEIDKIWKSECP